MKYLAPILFLVCSCTVPSGKAKEGAVKKDSLVIIPAEQKSTGSPAVPKKPEARENNGPELTESFTDSVTIGRKSLNKVILQHYRNNEGNYVNLQFYSKQNGLWILKNGFHLEKDGFMPLSTALTDFNNDGLNDLTYISGTAARGANEIRSLFIYDKIYDKLVFIKNSPDYPNLLYNKELRCIDAFLVYGGCSTVFLKLEGNHLREFASVELFDGLTVTTYDRHGNEKIIFRDSTNKMGYTRYKNFSPLKEYEDY